VLPDDEILRFRLILLKKGDIWQIVSIFFSKTCGNMRAGSDEKMYIHWQLKG